MGGHLLGEGRRRPCCPCSLASVVGQRGRTLGMGERSELREGGWGRAATALPWTYLCHKKNGRHEETGFSMLPQNNLFTFYAPFCQVLASARGVLSIEQHLRVFFSSAEIRSCHSFGCRTPAGRCKIRHCAHALQFQKVL